MRIDGAVCMCLLFCQLNLQKMMNRIMFSESAPIHTHKKMQRIKKKKPNDIDLIFSSLWKVKAILFVYVFAYCHMRFGSHSLCLLLAPNRKLVIRDVIVICYLFCISLSLAVVAVVVVVVE